MVVILRLPFLIFASGMQADVFVRILIALRGLWIDAATSLLLPVDSWMDRQHSFKCCAVPIKSTRKSL